jgi:hypothetical protein
MKAAATFLSEHYGAPTMLFALLIGLSLSFLSEQTPGGFDDTDCRLCLCCA